MNGRIFEDSQHDKKRHSVREKIDRGWREAKAGKLLTPDEVRESLKLRKAALRSKR